MGSKTGSLPIRSKLAEYISRLPMSFRDNKPQTQLQRYVVDSDIRKLTEPYDHIVCGMILDSDSVFGCFDVLPLRKNAYPRKFFKCCSIDCSACGSWVADNSCNSYRCPRGKPAKCVYENYQNLFPLLIDYKSDSPNCKWAPTKFVSGATLIVCENQAMSQALEKVLNALYPDYVIFDASDVAGDFCYTKLGVCPNSMFLADVVIVIQPSTTRDNPYRSSSRYSRTFVGSECGDLDDFLDPSRSVMWDTAILLHLSRSFSVDPSDRTIIISDPAVTQLGTPAPIILHSPSNFGEYNKLCKFPGPVDSEEIRLRIPDTGICCQPLYEYCDITMPNYLGLSRPAPTNSFPLCTPWEAMDRTERLVKLYTDTTESFRENLGHPIRRAFYDFEFELSRILSEVQFQNDHGSFESMNIHRCEPTVYEIRLTGRCAPCFVVKTMENDAVCSNEFYLKSTSNNPLKIRTRWITTIIPAHEPADWLLVPECFAKLIQCVRSWWAHFRLLMCVKYPMWEPRYETEILRQLDAGTFTPEERKLIVEFKNLLKLPEQSATAPIPWLPAVRVAERISLGISVANALDRSAARLMFLKVNVRRFIEGTRAQCHSCLENISPDVVSSMMTCGHFLCEVCLLTLGECFDCSQRNFCFSYRASWTEDLERDYQKLVFQKLEPWLKTQPRLKNKYSEEQIMFWYNSQAISPECMVFCYLMCYIKHAHVLNSDGRGMFLINTTQPTRTSESETPPECSAIQEIFGNSGYLGCMSPRDAVPLCVLTDDFGSLNLYFCDSLRKYSFQSPWPYNSITKNPGGSFGPTRMGNCANFVVVSPDVPGARVEDFLKKCLPSSSEGIKVLQLRWEEPLE